MKLLTFIIGVIKNMLFLKFNNFKEIEFIGFWRVIIVFKLKFYVKRELEKLF